MATRIADEIARLAVKLDTGASASSASISATITQCNPPSA